MFRGAGMSLLPTSMRVQTCSIPLLAHPIGSPVALLMQRSHHLIRLPLAHLSDFRTHRSIQGRPCNSSHEPPRA
eukprot:scaffold11731_cov119-Isochrysis_galbana.AAC.3